MLQDLNLLPGMIAYQSICPKLYMICQTVCFGTRSKRWNSGYLLKCDVLSTEEEDILKKC